MSNMYKFLKNSHDEGESRIQSSMDNLNQEIADELEKHKVAVLESIKKAQSKIPKIFEIYSFETGIFVKTMGKEIKVYLAVIVGISGIAIMEALIILGLLTDIFK